ncbi:putative virion structural protein 18 [Salmonella phage STsAS]|nr:putative virion structural protein 18 [Salmonella phage STsAS]
MSFTLRWKNENPAGSVVKIYRGTAKLNPASLPAPIATLSNGEESWVDTTVLLNTSYYYLLTVTVGSRTVAGPQKYITVKNRRGIGNVDQSYYSDTDDLALLGNIAFAEQMNFDAMPAGFRALFGLSGTGTFDLQKFSHRGRMLYLLPNGARFIQKKFSWNDIYNAGLMYGVDGFGPEDGRGSLAGVDQNGLFDWQGDTYRVRCIRGLTDVGEPTVMTLPDEINGVDHDLTDYGRCEYNDLVYPNCEFVPKKQTIPNWQNLMVYYFLNAGSSWLGAGWQCMERDPVSNKVVMRGSAPNTTGTGDANKTNLTTIKLVDPDVATGFFVPVIELME